MFIRDRASNLGKGDEVFDPSAASKRMKIPTPITWETELSASGNTAENWKNLVMSRKLPFMALVRNLRYMIITGFDPEAVYYTHP